MEVSSLPRPSGGILPRSRRLLATLGDDRLVDQLRRGNDAAFEVIFDRHHRAILSFCRHMLSSREEAEDAVQHTFISAHADLVAGDKEIRLKPWLYTIARNRCLSMLRARREQAAEIADIPTAGFGEQVQQRDDLRELLADMRDLPEDQRAALVLSELGDLSHAEIAEIVGCETLKVKSLVFQARSSLIESRSAREIPCQEIREQLATLRGGALRRGPLRRHLRTCAGCSEFRDQVKSQRQMMAALIPVIPSAGLKAAVLGGVGLGPAAAGLTAAGGGAGAAGAGAAGTTGAGAAASGGGLLSAAGGGGVAKLAVAAAIATGAIGGGVAVERSVVSSNEKSDNPVVASDSGAGGAAASGTPGAAAGGGGVAAAAVAATGHRHADLVRNGLGGGSDSPRAAHGHEGARGATPGVTGHGAQNSSGAHVSHGHGQGTRSYGHARHGSSHGHGHHRGSSGSHGSHRRPGRTRHEATVKPPKHHAPNPPPTTAPPPPPPPPPADEQDDGSKGKDHPKGGGGHNLSRPRRPSLLG